MADTERMKQLRVLLEEDPTDPFLRYGLAMEFVSQKDDATAVGQFRDLLADHPTYVPAYLMLGQTLVRLNDEDGAKAVLREGADAAGKSGNDHARGEMLGLLESLE